MGDVRVPVERVAAVIHRRKRGGPQCGNKAGLVGVQAFGQEGPAADFGGAGHRTDADGHARTESMRFIRSCRARNVLRICPNRTARSTRAPNGPANRRVSV